MFDDYDVTDSANSTKGRTIWLLREEGGGGGEAWKIWEKNPAQPLQ